MEGGEPMEAGRALDNSMFAGLAEASCAQTRLEFAPWWAVELGGSHHVVGVQIYSQHDHVVERFSPFSVWVTELGTSIIIIIVIIIVHTYTYTYTFLSYTYTYTHTYTYRCT